ncbi:MAG: hypothetical protein DMG35_19845 [Acidobacteria bacterium]|nr:MAG: hypothetical protein DMG35_19845 [Acidobacteriota bacterium]
MTYLRVGGILPILEPPLPEFFVGGFFGRCFASWLAFEAGEGVFEHLGDAAAAGFGSATRPKKRRGKKRRRAAALQAKMPG